MEAALDPEVQRAAAEIKAAGPDPAQKAEAMAAANKVLSVLPFNWLTNGVFLVVVPAVLGVLLVYLILAFSPETILAEDQIVELKRAEKEAELKKRGAQSLDGVRKNRAQ